MTKFLIPFALSSLADNCRNNFCCSEFIPRMIFFVALYSDEVLTSFVVLLHELTISKTDIINDVKKMYLSIANLFRVL